MSLIGRFAAYAAAFEKAYSSNSAADWAAVRDYFAPDAVYDPGVPGLFGEQPSGRDAIIGYFQWVLDAFDRRFGSRTLNLLDGPHEEGDAVWIRGTATYSAPGVPDFVLELKETVTFDGERIAHMVDAYEPEMEKALLDYIAKHGARLGIESGAH